ncbi:RsiV family protein [uncultured Haemophilus sp.]|uniref:RsiV family protein n=1 Tax=uncultured Haemophilus sp. TaxID=237779 RepID=UPI0025F7933D|nr:RsiV family protein [uncultured Haemophilus sp.]
MKKTFISALILTALFTVTGCEDKEAKATIAQQTQTIAQLTAENTQLKAEKEKAEKVIPAIFAEKDVIFEKVEKIKYSKSQERWFSSDEGEVNISLLGLKTNVAWLNDLLWSELVKNDFGENVSKTRDQMLSKYKTIWNDVKESLEKEPELGFSSNTWMIFVGQKEKLATFAIRYYSYTGGAHGLGGSEYLTIDMTTHKVLTLSDIIEQKKLPEVKELLWSFYTDYGRIKDEDAFTKKTDFDVSKNFYLAHDGIHFIYHVYEIASYAAGEQDLVIPWVWLQRENLLTSDFVKQKYYDLGYEVPVKE